MKIIPRKKNDFERHSSRLNAARYNNVNYHLGTNSLGLSLVFIICAIVTLRSDVLNLSYLRGLNDDLTFFMGFFSIIMGVGFYSFWRLGEKSVYSFHLTKSSAMPAGANVLYSNDVLSFAISNRARVRVATSELPSMVRQLLSIGIFISLALLTLGNSEFNRLKQFPAEVMASDSGYCPTKEEAENAPPKQGCELIIRAYKLGYAKDLGICEPEQVDPEKMQVCEKRRRDEPYLHYMARLLLKTANSAVAFFEDNKARQIEDKFRLQLKDIEVLRDYQRYAISAAPRASHHIWTNLPYPGNEFVEKYRKYLNPSYCIEEFQNQTNTIRLADNDPRQDSKVLEHVYGQLLFNPKSRNTVAFCKEYKIHWNSAQDTCDRLVKDPQSVLVQSEVLEEIQLVLHRHDIANSILSLDENIKKIEGAGDDKKQEKNDSADKNKSAEKSGSRNKDKNRQQGKIVKDRIAKDKNQLRSKNQLVSFQCFMQTEKEHKRNKKRTVKMDGTQFLVRTNYFPKLESKGDTQIAMYKQFSGLLENRFHYSKLSSRSDINIEAEMGIRREEGPMLQEPDYLLTRLEKLKNIDIFLDNSWVLEREDLLDVYPYHVHLQNYVNSFRDEYKDKHGRL